jgi:hypothetical protein
MIDAFINDNYIVRYEQNINIHTKSIIGSFIRINKRFGKELNSDIFHQSIKNAIVADLESRCSSTHSG